MTSNNLSSSDNKDQGFSEHWLSLREPADHAARDTDSAQALADWALHEPAVNILELGAGTGSNVRYLMPRLGHEQHWLILDNDSELLGRLPEILKTWCELQEATLTHETDHLTISHPGYSATIKTRSIDLAQELDDIDFGAAQLVTASALLDLTAKSWLDKLAEHIVSNRCNCLFALNYNGKIQWQTELDFDQQITQLLNAHQFKNKGFGTALGPAAGNYFADALQALGRDVHTKASDWDIRPQAVPLQHAIIDGWAEAAQEQDSDSSAAIRHWHAARKQMIEQQQSTLRVSHVDVLSLI